MKLAHAVLFPLALLGILAAAPVHAAPPAEDALGADAARADIKATFGFVPSFLALFPDEGIAGAWSEFKAVQLNPKSAVPSKYKELIGLAVAAQVPCEYCVYFHTKAAMANGASDREVREAVAMASVVRHWSTILNGAQLDDTQFRRDLDQVVANALAAASKPAPTAPPRPAPTDVTSARADIAATLGFVPAFFAAVPDAGLAGAWRELKTLQLNPSTAIPVKYKELIGLAVASQIPCRYCVAFHSTVAGKLAGASDAELHEAVAMAGIVRHWSTFLNGMQIDPDAFKREVDRALGGGKSARP